MSGQAEHGIFSKPFHYSADERLEYFLTMNEPVLVGRHGTKTLFWTTPVPVSCSDGKPWKACRRDGAGKPDACLIDFTV